MKCEIRNNILRRKKKNIRGGGYKDLFHWGSYCSLVQLVGSCTCAYQISPLITRFKSQTLPSILGNIFNHFQQGYLFIYPFKNVVLLLFYLTLYVSHS